VIYFGLISSLVNVLASLTLGIAIFSKKPRDSKTLTFTWVTVSVAVWSGFYFCWMLSRDVETAFIYCQCLSAAAIVIPVFYFHFTLRLTNRPDGIRELFAGYSIALLLAGLSFTPLIVARVEPNRWFPFWPKPGMLYPAYLTFFFYFLMRTAFLLMTTFRQASFFRRNQLRYILVFTLIGFIGGATNYFLWYDVPVPPVGNVLVSLYMIGVGYAVIRFRLMEFNLLIARGVTYTAVALIVVVFQGVVVALIDWGQGRSFQIDLNVLGGALVSTAILFGPIPWLRRRLDGVLERRVLGKATTRQGRLWKLIHEISSIKDVDSIFRETVKSVAEALELDNVGLFLRFEFDSKFTLRAATGTRSQQLHNGRFSDSMPLMKSLQESKHAVLLDELENRLTARERDEIVRLRGETGIELVVPIYADNFLYGFLALGQSKPNFLFTNTEISLLETLSLQLGLNLRSRQLERQSNQAEKLIALGTLAAGLAHEIRNPLVSIRTFSELIGEQGADPEFRREFKSVVGRDVSRIATIVENISAFADNAQVKTSPVDIQEVINGVYDIARPEFMQAGVVFDAPKTEVVLVSGNYSQLLQVFLNLFQNAIHALEGRPEPRVTVGYKLVNDDEGGRTVIVSVTDNGAGIDDVVRARIFDPFITTKATGDGQKRGMGLGLAIVKRIVEGHRGAITVSSEAGRGTTFFVHLPCLP
jgi:two-component system nitrogen regulation sensor histidine kinase GlnL